MHVCVSSGYQKGRPLAGTQQTRMLTGLEAGQHGRVRAPVGPRATSSVLTQEKGPGPILGLHPPALSTS